MSCRHNNKNYEGKGISITEIHAAVLNMSAGGRALLEKEQRQKQIEESNKTISVNAYELWMAELEKSIKFDLAPKTICLLTCLSAYSAEPQNNMMKGESSIGKTWNAVNVIKYFPSEDVWLLGGLSPTALVHDKAQLEDEGTGEPLDENYVSDYMKEWRLDHPDATKKEEKQVYNEKKAEWDAIPKKYVVDLSHRILLFLDAPHIDTFNKLRPILSHDTYEITYKFTDKSTDGLATQTVVMRGFPATIFCTTDKDWIEDLATRSFTATPSTTPEKLKAAIVLTARRKSYPWEFKKDDGEEYREYIRSLKKELLNGWIPIVPFLPELAAVTPSSLGRDMRDFSHISTLIEMMGLLHFYARPKVLIDDEKYVLVTIKDFLNILKVWRDIEETTRTGLGGEEITIFKNLVDLEHTLDYITLKDLVMRYNQEQAKKISSSTARKYLDSLCDVGLVDKQHDDRNKENYPDANARQNLYRSLKVPDDAISRAWKNAVPFFTETRLLDWFTALLQNSSQKQAKCIIASNEGNINHLVALDENGEVVGKQFVADLFKTEYSLPPKTLDAPTKLEEEPEKGSSESKPTLLGEDLEKIWVDAKTVLEKVEGEAGWFIFQHEMERRGYHSKQLPDLIQPLLDRGLLSRTVDTIKLGERKE